MSLVDASELMQMTELHLSLLGNNRLLRTLQPYTDQYSLWQDGGGGSGDTINSTPPWIDPPPDSAEFDEAGLVALPVAPSIDTTVLQVVVPRGFDGTIKAYNVNFLGGGFVPGSGTIVWRVNINGTPVRNFSNITTERGSPEQARPLSGSIRVFSEQTITIVVNHASDNTLAGDVVAGLQGWFYPSRGK